MDCCNDICDVVIGKMELAVQCTNKMEMLGLCDLLCDCLKRESDGWLTRTWKAQWSHSCAWETVSCEMGCCS